jgi:uncharacterized protein YjeT (DUF2065 family)
MILPSKAKTMIDDALVSVKEAASRTSGFVIAAIGIAVLALVVSLACLIGIRHARLAS